MAAARSLQIFFFMLEGCDSLADLVVQGRFTAAEAAVAVAAQ